MEKNVKKIMYKFYNRSHKYESRGFSFVRVCSCLFAVKFLLVIFLLSSCLRQEKHDGIFVAVSIPPQAWFVSQIAGDKARSFVLVPPGQNPHNYEPTPRQIQNLASASAWILSGSDFEITLTPKISALFPNLQIVDGTKGVQFRLMQEHEHHDCDDDHHHSLEIDRHTWMGREPAKILAMHIRDTLSQIDSENEAYYQERYAHLASEIDAAFNELKIKLSSLEGKSVFVYDPSFGYFFDEFGIVQEAVETGGKEPTPRELNRLIAKVNEEKPSAIFVQSQFPASAARSLAAATGVELLSLDPLAEKWLENIMLIGQTLYKLIQ